MSQFGLAGCTGAGDGPSVENGDHGFVAMVLMVWSLALDDADEPTQ